MKKVSFLVVSLLILGACGDEKPKSQSGEVVSAVAEGAETDEELKAELKRIEEEEKKRIEEEKSSVTTFTFNKMEHDFGTIKADTDNFTEFIVTNTGAKPLVIEDVKASCGCTTPEKPEKPIAPGKSDKIKVKFHPSAEQLNEIRKTITVVANTDPRISTVSVRAFVKEK